MMEIIKRVMLIIPCEKAQTYCCKAQYGELKWWEAALFKWHIMMCKMCRTFSKKNYKLTEVINKSEVDCFSEKELKELHNKFEKELQS